MTAKMKPYGLALARSIAAQIITRNKLERPPKNDQELERYDNLVLTELHGKESLTLRTIVNGKDDYATYEDLVQQAFLMIQSQMKEIFEE